MKIRYAILKDAEDITKNNKLLAKESENLTIDNNTVLAGVKALLSDKNKGFYLVAEENDKNIGQLMITFEWSDWHNKNMWWLQSVYVNELWREKGVFSLMFNKIKELALENDVDILRLYVHIDNKKAKEVYKTKEMEKEPYAIYQISL